MTAECSGKELSPSVRRALATGVASSEEEDAGGGAEASQEDDEKRQAGDADLQEQTHTEGGPNTCRKPSTMRTMAHLRSRARSGSAVMLIRLGEYDQAKGGAHGQHPPDFLRRA